MPPGVRDPTTARSHMTASDTNSRGCKNTDGTTTSAQTHFDARDRLAGRLDDTTVRQAAGGRR